MLLYFGLELDDLCHPIPYQATGGVHYAGTKGLIHTLEIRLGLGGYPTDNEYLRIEQYRQALTQYLEINPEAFYQKSFDADQFATATELLSRRDELLLAGWNFAQNKDLPDRLNVLAALESKLHTLQHQAESSAGIELAPGYADRFWAVEAHTELIANFLEQVTINEPFELLPRHLLRFFEALQKAGVRFDSKSTQLQNSATDLATFQKIIFGSLESQPKRTLKADGSLLLLEAKRETDAAAYLAKIFHYNPDFQPVCLIPEKNRALDNALIQEGLPSMGILSASLARPILQILKLAPAFLWEPIDPFKIMEFVSLSVKPLEEELANRIATQLAETPGLNGEGWYAMISRYFDELPNKTNDQKTIRKIREQYNFWFERQRYDSSRTVPKSDVIAIFNYLKQWAFEAFEDSNDENQSLLVLSEQAKRIQELLETLPETQLTSLELERIVRTIYEPAPVQFQAQETDFLPHVHQTSAIIDPVEEVLWWNFVQHEPVHFFSRWYQSERQFLQEQDIQLDTPQEQNERLLWQRKRPILQAQQRLVLVIPKNIEGKEAHAHPLMGDLSAAFENLDAVTFNIDSQKGKETFARFFQLPKLVQLSPKTLHPPRPFLHIPALQEFIESEYETFSSLEALFYYPYQWVFQHKIKLKKSSILSVVNDNRLMGKLAHRFFEKLFQQEVTTWQKPKIEQWIEQEARTLLSREGAVLLMYGKEPERINFLNRLKYATWSLVSLVQNNGWQVKATEMDLEGQFENVAVRAKADLVLQKENEHAVVDLKWRGITRRENSIRNEEDLQLVLYSNLLTDDNKWAHTSYFIIERGRLIARNNLAFKEITPIAGDSDHSSINERIFNKMAATYHWRMEQIRKGLIEIRSATTKDELEDAYEDFGLTPPGMDMLEMRDDDAPFDDYKTLIQLLG